MVKKDYGKPVTVKYNTIIRKPTRPGATPRDPQQSG